MLLNTMQASAEPQNTQGPASLENLLGNYWTAALPNMDNMGMLPQPMPIQQRQQGAMSGVMNVIGEGFGEMDDAMTGAFNTIRESLNNNYTTQEVLVPNNAQQAQQPIPFMPSPIQNQQHLGLYSAAQQNNLSPTPPGGIGNAQLLGQQPTPVPRGGMQSLNQDSGMDGQLSQEELINQLYANMSGQYNG